MKCNCIDKVCDPVNGCNLSSTGIDITLISYYLTCHFQPSSNICKVSYASLFSEYPVTHFKGFDYKMVTTRHLESEVSISESKLDLRSNQCN